ncbi:hypothetical protein HMSSN139_53960 [Paenibacillus sp. HMSSN-139]|nr:hypothetical protein HMSSN139_53960 [Paenibacillus sp. HMSSN-139]
MANNDAGHFHSFAAVPFGNRFRHAERSAGGLQRNLAAVPCCGRIRACPGLRNARFQCVDRPFAARRLFI